MAEVDPDVADRPAVAGLQRPPGRHAARRRAAAPRRDYLQERGVHTAMLAMLPGEDRVIGTLMLSNRYGVVRDFSADDLQAVRDARQQRVRRAAVRPPRAGDRPPEDLQQQLATRPSTTR
jgi:hypothetical protein